VSLTEDEITRVLAVTAHPDDVDFGAAGTVATMTDRGVHVAYCVCTDGDAGGFDHEIDRREIPRIRRREQTEAAAEVGVTELHFLGHRDGRLEASLALRRDIARVIRQVRPDVVITQSPDRNYARVFASHPDHRAAGGAALDAVYPDARNPFGFTELAAEGLPPWTVREVWLMASPAQLVDTYVDVTDTVERKLAALRRHESQLQDGGAGLAELIHGWLAANATAAGLPEGRLAEAYQRVVTG
jgi:LmbE family N-acetylglucosaminyl deacetylase